MRFAIAVLIVALTMPAAEAAQSPNSQCKTRCGSMYRFCLTSASTKQARKACKATRSRCAGQCGGK
jgi:hypothetical protein